MVRFRPWPPPYTLQQTMCVATLSVVRIYLGGIERLNIGGSHGTLRYPCCACLPRATFLVARSAVSASPAPGHHLLQSIQTLMSFKAIICRIAINCLFSLWQISPLTSKYCSGALRSAISHDNLRLKELRFEPSGRTFILRLYDLCVSTRLYCYDGSEVSR